MYTEATLQAYASVDEITMALDSKRRFTLRHTIIGAVACLLIAGGILWSTGKHLPAPAKAPHFPTYSNVSINYRCQQILKEARNKLYRSSHNSITTQDSLNLINSLDKALKKAYPLPFQQNSAGFQAQWKAICEEVSSLKKD